MPTEMRVLSHHPLFLPRGWGWWWWFIRNSRDCHLHSSHSWILASLPQICRRHRSEFPTPCIAPVLRFSVGRQRSGVQPGWSQGSLGCGAAGASLSSRAHAAPRDAGTAGACDCFSSGSSAGLVRDSCVRSIPDGPASPSNPHRSGPRAAQTPACLQRAAVAAPAGARTSGVTPPSAAQVPGAR